METILEGKGLTKCFGIGETRVTAVDHVDFSILEGELVVILGQSGAGKSTLLNLLGGMDVPSEGELLFRGKNLAAVKTHERTEYRRNKVGFVFQFFNLMPNLTALENVEIVTELSKDSLSPKSVLEQVGLNKRMDHFPSQLSGGEQQRVSIARAIAKNAEIILCDEPTGALDYDSGKAVLSLLQRQSRVAHKTVIIVTHNGALSLLADHVLRIRDGKIIEDIHNEEPRSIEEIEW